VLRVGEEEVAEIALDETAVSIDDQNPMHLLRVEVEVQAPWVQALAPLVEDLRRSAGLAPAALSKFEAGVLARGYVIPSGVELGSTEIHSDDTVGAVADAVIRRLLGSLLAHEAGTRLGEDPEDLHDMRVATRRLRAAIGVFSGVLPAQFDSLAPELAWLGKVLGSVRDLDVQVERLEASTGWHGPWAASAAESSPVEDLRGVFAREREEARAGLLEALESPRYERLTTALVALAQQGAGHRTTAGQQRATAVVPDLVERRHRAARKAARRARRSGAPEDFHRLRIRCKRLRYALEFVADLYGEPAVTFIRRLARLQDLLGGLQDCQVSMDRLHSLALGAEPPLSLPSVFFMGALAEEARAMAEHLLTDARTRVKVLKGAEWRDLARVLERLRPTPGAGEQANGPGTSGLQLGRPAAIGAVGLGPDRPSFAPDPPRPLGDPSPPRA
jgi:CHAD domain-containing protein